MKQKTGHKAEMNDYNGLRIKMAFLGRCFKTKMSGSYKYKHTIVGNKKNDTRIHTPLF